MAGILFSPRACGCLSTRGMFLLSVCEGSDSWLEEGWKQAWYPVSPPSRLGQLGRQMRGLRGFCALVLSVTGRPAESWWWEGLQAAWSSSWECCGYTVCPGSRSWAAAREVTDPLVCRKALWFGEAAGSASALGVAEVRQCPMGLVGLCIQPCQLPSLQPGSEGTCTVCHCFPRAKVNCRREQNASKSGWGDLRCVSESHSLLGLE